MSVDRIAPGTDGTDAACPAGSGAWPTVSRPEAARTGRGAVDASARRR